jgi:Rrf2 family iron-sulfur cluster assembly transcriptional regulator
MAELGKDGKPVSVNMISEKEKISQVFLEQIFFKLRKAGIVNSTRGPGGGFCFALPLEKITIKQILDASGEDLEITECDRHINCERDPECLSHTVWAGLDAIINDYFEKITIASLLRNAKR